MDDLERVFQHLVQVLAENDPRRLTLPFQVAELYEEIIPYRRHRTVLGFDAVEDYEMTLLRLLAGEGGLAEVDPPEAREALEEEARAVHPEPGAFRYFAAATVWLQPAAVRRVLDAPQAYAPPGSQPDHDADSLQRVDRPRVGADVPPAGAPHAVAAPSDVTRTPDVPGVECLNCSAPLPPGRRVAFCPFCGQSIGSFSCANCGEQLERGWRHCITCGAPVVA